MKEDIIRFIKSKEYKYLRDCREMLKIVFGFPNELIDKVMEIS